MDDGKRALVVTLAVTLPFLFWGIGSISFLEPNEGMYGSIAREMAEGGDWITPHFNQVPYLHKPPLYFWLTGFTVYLFGPSEWAVRLWSSLPALGTAILIWRLGRMLYGDRGGLLSALVFASSVGVFRYARVAAPDFLLVFSLTLSIYGFVKATLRLGSWDAGRRSGLSAFRPSSLLAYQPSGLLFWLGMALGVLTKGLIGVVLPLLIVGLFVLVTRASSQWSTVNGQGGGGRTIDHLRFTIYSPLGILLFLGLALPWHLLVAWENPGFIDFYFVDNQWLRFLSRRALSGDEIPVGTLSFLILTLVWFFPWSLFLPAALCQGISDARSGGSRQERLRRVPGLWALTVLGFFSLASYKLEHYFLPAIPALSLLVGALWAQGFAASATNGERSVSCREAISLRWCLGIGSLGSVLVGLSAFFLSDLLTPQALLAGLGELNVYYRILKGQGAALPFASISPFVELLKELGAVLIIGLPLSFILCYFHMPKASYVTVLCVGGALALLVFKLLLIVEPHHSVRSISVALNIRANPGDVIVHVGPLEYSGGLPFYTGREVYVLNGNTGTLDFGSRYPEAQGIFLNDVEFARLWESDKKVFLVTRLPEQASVLKTIPPENTHLIGRYDSRLLYSNVGS